MSQLEEINVRMISLHNSRKQIQQINDLLDVLDTKLSDLWRYKMSHINESYTVTHKTVNFFMSISCNKCSFQKAFLFLAKWLRCKTLMVWDRPLQDIEVLPSRACEAPVIGYRDCNRGLGFYEWSTRSLRTGQGNFDILDGDVLRRSGLEK